MSTFKSNPPTEPTIKKAAIRQDEPLSENMNYTNHIEPRSKDPLDITEGVVPSSLRDEAGSGATECNESLKDSQRGGYVKRMAFTPPDTPNKQTISTPNKASKRGGLTAESNPFKHIKTGIDQVTLVFVTPYYRRYTEWLKTYFRGDPIHTGSGQFYKDKYTHAEAGYSILTGHNVNDQAAKVEFDARGWNQLTPQQQIRLLKDCYNMGGRVSRIDLFQDTFGENITLVEDAIIHAALPRTTRLKQTVICSAKQGQSAGTTINLGSFSSKRYWRVYDKGAEQGGQCNKWQRVEMECKKEYADQVGQKLTAESADAVTFLPETIRNLIFSADVWTEPLDWWDKQRTANVSLSSSKEQINLERFVKYMGKQVLPRLRTLADELNIRLEHVLLHINNLDTDGIVSVPKSCPLLIEEFYNSYLDKPDPPNNNTKRLPLNVTNGCGSKRSKSSEQAEPPRSEQSPKDTNYLSETNARRLSSHGDRGTTSACEHSIRSEGNHHIVSRSTPLSLGQETIS